MQVCKEDGAEAVLREVCQPSGQIECIIFCNMITGTTVELWQTSNLDLPETGNNR